MKGYRVKHLRLHVGVQLIGQVVTSLDADKASCTIEDLGNRYFVHQVIRDKDYYMTVPDTNVIFAQLEKDAEPNRSAKAS